MKYEPVVMNMLRTVLVMNSNNIRMSISTMIVVLSFQLQ